MSLAGKIRSFDQLEDGLVALLLFSIHKLCIFIHFVVKVKLARNAQAQNPKSQIPNKFQILNPKFQTLKLETKNARESSVYAILRKVW